MKHLLLYVLMPFSLLIFSCGAQAQKPAATVPLFTFYQLDGKPFSKANLITDQNSLFIFFDVSCEHCQRMITEINKKYTMFKNAHFYFVSMYEPDQIRGFMTVYAKTMYGKKNVTLLQDRNREFIPKFMPEKYPATYVYSPKGNLVRYFSGEQKVDDLIVAANRNLK
ncbi:MAG: redoxin domain-containing protein [Mucilaginibacter polytrichastri]|nr:redoxin domain-containing protein [Mucilaginibacter polytrichastri]